MQNDKCEFIEANGIRINYCSYGNKNKPAVIFIHGYPLDQSMWNDQVKFLKPDYHVITYDMRGFGQTESGGEAYSLPLFADDVAQLMNALNIKKGVICGFSMGGYIALNAYIKHPELFSGLVLHDSQCHADNDAGREQRMQSIEFIRKNGVKAYTGPFVKKMVAASSLINTQLISWLEKTMNSQSGEQLCKILQMLADRKETCTFLKAIDIPVLVLRGSEDAIISEEKTEFMNSEIKMSEHITINNAGHLSNMEQPVQFNDSIKKFLSTVYG